MQPLTGYSIYDEHLERRGEGLRHVKFYYADCKKAVADFALPGYPVIQSGRFHDDEHYYLDTEKETATSSSSATAAESAPPSAAIPLLVLQYW